MSAKTRPRRRKPGDVVIETDALTKRFGPIVAVSDLDLTVSRGEVFGYLGPNGAGKSTTIRMLLDFIRPTAGSYRVLGGSGADPEIRKRTGYLPGDLSVDPRYTAEELFAFYGQLRGGLDRAYVDALLDRFDLDPTRPNGKLSTGNRRKVGIIQAFMHRPELLILDEPTSGLDPLLQHQFQLLVREVAADGATVFLSSHVLDEVEALADRVAILRKGELVELASVADLRARARQRIVLSFNERVDPKEFERIAEVVEAKRVPRGVQLTVGGSVERVLRKAAQLHAHRIVSLEADLEEIFLEMYQGDAE